MGGIRVDRSRILGRRRPTSPRLGTVRSASAPLSKPTPQFKSNADIAAARAKVAAEHLAQFARAGKGLAFDSRAGDLSQAPFPNDTPQNRRLNRTATVQVIPAP